MKQKKIWGCPSVECHIIGKSVSLFVSPLILAWQWLPKHIPVAMNTHATKEETLHD
jgi:hypothetical protein